ncbi:MAG: efflux RND transporter periplasmic adaptor subunit [Gammaproteobacteria bacterium]|jgi:RND family efflux transporter MFP subunit|nr:efflux RND transporter periplasmic adaptor subunit [Gammaproteobacteria bacterium]
MRLILFIALLVLLGGCKAPSDSGVTAPPVKSVYTVTLTEQSQILPQSYSGTVRARHEIPVAFQVGGRIQHRLVNAGQTVAPGDVLFRLDPQELEQTLVATKAMLSAATAELEVAEADVVRYRALFGKDSISQQAFEREKMAERAAKAQWESAQAQVRHAEIALRHTVLKATAPGILIDVSGNVGQVVAAGQPIALLADLNEWEIEVFLPDGFPPPPTASAHFGNRTVDLKLREVAGAADATSRTWRVRYSLEKRLDLKLGMLVHVVMQANLDDHPRFTVPLSALDERGDGAHVWKIVEQRAQRFPVSIMDAGPSQARIHGAHLQLGDRIIALGTHLLEPDQSVRARQP